MRACVRACVRALPFSHSPILHSLSLPWAFADFLIPCWKLLERICEDEERSEVWIVEDGEVEPYDGDFEDYKDELIKEIAAELDEDEQ